jgi:hypothetical protein
VTPLARHCALVAAGPRIWWLEKPAGQYHARKAVPVRDTIDAYIAALPAGQDFGSVDIVAAHPDLVRHTVVLIMADLLKAGRIVRVRCGRYVRATP